MPRQKMTEEQKMERKLAKKAEKQAQREAEWNARKAVWAQQAEESRKQHLEKMDESLRSRFIKAVEYASNINNDFFRDLLSRWQRFGNLSEKQVDVLVRSAERDMMKESANEMIEDWFQVGSKIDTPKLTVLSVKVVETAPAAWGAPSYTTRVTLQHSSGIYFTVKSNSEKLLEKFREALEQKKQVKLNATIKWHFDGSDTVILTSRGMKFLNV